MISNLRVVLKKKMMFRSGPFSGFLAGTGEPLLFSVEFINCSWRELRLFWAVWICVLLMLKLLCCYIR